MGLFIQRITASHLEELTALFVSCDRPEVTRNFHPFPLSRESAERLARSPGLDKYYGAWVDGVLVGLTMLRGWNEGYNIPSLGVMVNPVYKGRGIGRALTEFAIGEAARLKSPALRLSVYESNRRGYELYRRLGFKEIDRAPIEIDGHCDIRIVMLKQISGD